MTDRSEDSIQLPLDPTRRAFLGAGALTLLGLAAPTVRPAAAQTPKRRGTLVVAAHGSPPGLAPQKSPAAPGLGSKLISLLLRAVVRLLSRLNDGTNRSGKYAQTRITQKARS